MKNFLLILVSVFSLYNYSYSQFVQERKIEADEIVIENQKMEISVIDGVTEAPMTADIIIRGLNPRKPVLLEAIKDTIVEIENYRIYTVSCIKKGYMIYSEKFWPDEVQLHVQKVKLDPIEIGKTVNLLGIYFIGNKTQVNGKSKEAIDELITWLNLNKSVKIAVIGHVNGPNNNKSERFYQKASLERSRSVVTYLINNGIEEDRLVSKGKGNMDMLYPAAETSWETEANRRIEIEIIGFNLD